MAGRRAGGFLGGRACGPQFCKTVTGLQGLRAFWIAADQAAQLLHSGIALAEFQQRISFLQLSGGGLVSAGILVKDFVVSLHGAGVVSLAIRDFSQVELRVAGKIGISIDL